MNKISQMLPARSMQKKIVSAFLNSQSFSDWGLGEKFEYIGRIQLNQLIEIYDALWPTVDYHRSKAPTEQFSRMECRSDWKFQ